MYYKGAVKKPSRRTFLRHSLGLAAAAVVMGPSACLRAADGTRTTLRLGGPVFNAPADPDALAALHRQLGYRAAYCPALSLKEPDRIRAVEAAFAKHDVVIAEVGRWVNLLDADPDQRRKNLETVTEGLALADAVGALDCVDIAGSFSPASWFGPHPDNLTPRFFDAAVENARKIIDAVKPKRARFTYEVLGWALPDSPDHYLDLIRAIDRKMFGVHLDPCNLVNSPEKFYHNTALLNECFDKLGPWIVSCHGKDLTWDVEMNVHFREVVPGKGSLDYATYLRRLAALPHRPPLMLEHLATADEYVAAARHVNSVAAASGLAFE